MLGFAGESEEQVRKASPEKASKKKEKLDFWSHIQQAQGGRRGEEKPDVDLLGVKVNSF